jgi:hypothetical protein
MSVFERIRAEVTIGLELETPYGGEKFTVKSIDDTKLVFFIKSVEVEVTKESWNGIPAFLGKGWTRIGANHIASSNLDSDTLEKYLRDHTPPDKKRSQGSNVAPLLEYLGIGEVDHRRPNKIRMKQPLPES